MRYVSDTLKIFSVAIGILIAFATSASFAQSSMTLEQVGTGFARPVFATQAPGDSSRIFVLEQHTGEIKILDLNSGTTNPTPFLDVPSSSSGNERGLLGLAFDPAYVTNGRFYVNYTNSQNGATVVEQYTRSTANVANPTGTQVLSVSQPQSNHNAGWLGFGPDGFLYIATGDGGGSNDNGSGHTAGTGNSLDITNNLLGKILRVDVNGDDFPSDATRNYSVPASNPFVDQIGDDEIYAYGLRNPWRSSFDRQTGDFYIADVGQNTIEEINILLDGSNGGENFGWRAREGTIQTPGSVGGPKTADMIDPVYEYTHGGGDLEGFSVTGGYVYRGPISGLDGHYFFADFVTDRLWSFKFDGTTDPSLFVGANTTSFVDWSDILINDDGTPLTLSNISSFGEDADGNLYIVELGGDIYRISGMLLLGDVDMNGVVDFSDIPRFVTILLDGNFLAEADVNEDGVIDFSDIPPFVVLLLSSGA